MTKLPRPISDPKLIVESPGMSDKDGLLMAITATTFAILYIVGMILRLLRI